MFHFGGDALAAGIRLSGEHAESSGADTAAYGQTLADLQQRWVAGFLDVLCKRSPQGIDEP